MQFITQNEATAARRRIPLYLVDVDDGQTPVTGLTFSAGDVKISKAGGAQANHAGTFTELALGQYYYEFAAGEVDTLGYLSILLNKSTVRAFLAQFQVVALDLNTAATSAPTAVQIRQEMDSNSTKLANLTGDAFVRLGAPVGASISADIAGVQSDTDNIQTRLPAALVSGRMDVSVGAYPGNTVQTGDAFLRLGAPAGASVSADVAAVKGETASVQADTNDIQNRLPAALVGGRMDSDVAVIQPNAVNASALATDAVAEIQSGLAGAAAIVTAQADLDDIQARLPAALVGGRMDSSVGAYPGNTVQTGDAFSRLGAPAGASVSADVAAVKADSAAVKLRTDNLPNDPADASDIAGAFTTLNGNLATVNTNVLARAIPGDAMALTSGERNSIADAYLDRANGVEVGITPRQQMRVGLAADSGKLSGAATALVKIRNKADDKDRISAVVDSDGNRTSVTLDLT